MINNQAATQPAFRARVNAMLAGQAKPDTKEITFAEAKQRNAERLRAKQSALKAKIGSVIDSLDEIEVDKWTQEMAKKSQKMSGSVVVLGWGYRK